MRIKKYYLCGDVSVIGRKGPYQIMDIWISSFAEASEDDWRNGRVVVPIAIGSGDHENQ